MIAGLLVLTITGGPDYHSARSLQNAWNLGHILLFGLLSWFVLKEDGITGFNRLTGLILVFGLTLVLSVLIEWCQYICARGNPDLHDIWRNFLGMMVGILFAVKPSKRRLFIQSIRLVVLILVLAEIRPVVLMAYDEARARSRFPILADFESELELTRWTGGALYTLSKTGVIHGESSLKVEFRTTKYSGIFLGHAPRNWTGYDSLKFHIFYPRSDTLQLTCRIHDRWHNQDYYDRYNKTFDIKPGHNPISISMENVITAPKGRHMDVQNIYGLGLFTVQLPEPRTICLDYLHLKN